MTISRVKTPVSVVVPSQVKEAARPLSAPVTAAASAVSDLDRRNRDQQQSLFLQGRAAAGRAAQHLPSEVKDVLDTRGHIESLRPGQTWQLTTSAQMGMEGISADGSHGTLVSRRADGSFTVSAASTAGLGAGATGGAGLRTEYAFSSAADALKAANIIAAFRGGVPSAADVAFLKDHATALELSGQAAADVSQKLNLGLANFGASAGATGSLSVRVELTRPPSLSVAQTITGSVSGNGSAASVSPVDRTTSAGASVSARIERRFTLPDADAHALLTDPKVLTSSVAHAVRAAKDEVTLTVSGQAKSGATGTSTAATLQFGYPAGMFDPGIIGELREHGFRRALNLPNATEVRASVQTTSQQGTKLSGGVSDGVDASASVESTTSQTSTVWQYPAPGATATVAEASRALGSIPPPVRPSMPPP